MIARHQSESATPQAATCTPLLLLFAASLYLVCSAFGVLRVPGVEMTLANAALLLLGVACIVQGRFDGIQSFLFLASLMAIDLLVRVLEGRMDDIGYSINIGKLALFALVARQLATCSPSARGVMIVSFGIAAVASEMFALAYPEYREQLYNSQGLLSEIDDPSGLASVLYRPTGLIGDPNYFAVPLVMMALALFSRRRYGWFILVSLLVAITGSRAAMVALFLPIAIQQLYRARARPLRLSMMLVAILAVAVSAMGFNELLRGDTSDSNTERTLLLRQGLENVLSGSFLRATYGQPLVLGLGGEALVVHNTFLQTSVTSLLLACYLLWRSVAGLVRSPERMVLSGLLVEMMFLDVSSFSSILLAFVIVTERARFRPVRPQAAAPPVRGVPLAGWHSLSTASPLTVAQDNR